MYSVVLMLSLSGSTVTPAGNPQATVGCTGSTVRYSAPAAGCSGGTLQSAPATGCSGGAALGLRGRFVARRSTGPLRRIVAAVFPQRAPVAWNPNVQIVASDFPQPAEAQYTNPVTVVTGYRQVCNGQTCYNVPITATYARMPRSQE